MLLQQSWKVAVPSLRQFLYFVSSSLQNVFLEKFECCSCHSQSQHYQRQLFQFFLKRKCNLRRYLLAYHNKTSTKFLKHEQVKWNLNVLVVISAISTVYLWSITASVNVKWWGLWTKIKTIKKAAIGCQFSHGFVHVCFSTLFQFIFA